MMNKYRDGSRRNKGKGGTVDQRGREAAQNDSGIQGKVDPGAPPVQLSRRGTAQPVHNH